MGWATFWAIFLKTHLVTLLSIEPLIKLGLSPNVNYEPNMLEHYEIGIF
jgi:hypothetical protein